MDVKSLFATSGDVQGEVDRVVQKKALFHIPDSEDVDSVSNL
jgi:hypothetical protein